MKKLKSLKEFEGSSNVLNSNELKNISGGLLHTWWEVTTTSVGDRIEMAQQEIWDGSHYVPYGPKYATGKTMTFLG